MTPAELAKVIYNILGPGEIEGEVEAVWDQLDFSEPIVNTMAVTNHKNNEQFLINIKKVSK